MHGIGGDASRVVRDGDPNPSRNNFLYREGDLRSNTRRLAGVEAVVQKLLGHHVGEAVLALARHGREGTRFYVLRCPRCLERCSL